MLKWVARHREAVNELQVRVKDRDRRISELETRVERAEKTAHMIVEDTRYTLESAAQLVSRSAPETGETLANIVHVLPYVLSGRRHWDEPCFPDSASAAKESDTPENSKEYFSE